MDRCIICGDVKLSRHLNIKEAKFIQPTEETEAFVHVCTSCEEEFDGDIVFDLREED